MQNDINTGFALAQILNVIILGLCLAVPAILVVMVIRERWAAADNLKERGNAPLRFKGRGADVRDDFQPAVGTYKLKYELGTLTKIDLIDLKTGDRETLLIKSGIGSISFTVEHESAYELEIEPENESGTYVIEISPLGLPSRLG